MITPKRRLRTLQSAASFFFCASAFAVGAPTPVAASAAQTDAETTDAQTTGAETDVGPTLALLVENDYFAKNSEDRNFTNGVQAQWVSRPGRGPEFLHQIGRFFSPDGANAETRAAYGLGQRMYTPDSIVRLVPDPNDRPYGGLLYGSIGVLARTDLDTQGFFNQLDVFNVTLGVVGQISQADEIQRFVHRVSGAARPNAWRTQIDNRFAFEAEWRRIYRRKIIGENRGWSADVLPHFRVSAGNLTTQVGLGGMLRVGHNIPVDFGPPRTRAGVPGSAYQRKSAKFGWYLFGGVTGRYVPRNLFLDEESTLGQGVTREDFTGDGEAGFAFNIDGVQIAYTHVWRGQEFEEEIGSSKVGAISMTVNF